MKVKYFFLSLIIVSSFFSCSEEPFVENNQEVIDNNDTDESEDNENKDDEDEEVKKDFILCNPEESFQHVIITTESYKNATTDYNLKMLVEHRIKNGLNSTIVTTEEIKEKFDGRDDAEKIRNFIKEAYNNWKIKYVLLGGDTEQIPARILKAKNTDIASDMYYGCLEGDFNANNNNIWGEKDDDLDFTFEVGVGRASADNVDKMSNFVYKTITYENSPINASYHTKLFQYNADDTGIGDTGKPNSSWNKAYTDLCSNITAEYKKYKNSNPLAKQTISNRMSSGNLGYYLGAEHGTSTGTPVFKNEDVNNLGERDQFFFYASLSCLLGKFNAGFPCYAEVLTVNHRHKGAFAGFFNSVSAMPPHINQYLFQMRDKYLKDKILRLGDLRKAIAERYSYEEYMADQLCRYVAYHFNLFGDPATEWKMVNSKPIDLSVDFENRSGNTFLDNSGNNNNVIIPDGVNVESVDGGVLFDGTNYLVVNHNDWNPLGNQLEISLSLNIKIRELGESETTLLSKGKNNNPFILSLDKNGYLLFEYNKGNPVNSIGNTIFKSNDKLELNNWYNICITINYESGKLSIYNNNILDSEHDMPSEWYIGVNKEPLYIASDGNGNNFNGYLKSIKIYSRGLDATEISNL